MKTLISFLTCPGREESFKATFASAIRDGGLDVKKRNVIIYYDGQRESNLLDDFPVRKIVYGGHKSNLRSFLNVVRLAIEEPTVERLLYFEDDISFAKDAIRRMLSVGVPEGFAFTSFFDMKECFSGMPYGLHSIPLSGKDGRGFWGLQAVMFPRSSLLQIDRDEKLQDSKYRQHSDVLMAESLKRAGLMHYTCHIPCLVEHDGADASSIWGSKEQEISRRATNFLGYSKSAMDLP